MNGAFLGQLRNQGIEPAFVCKKSSSPDADTKFICFYCRNIPRRLFSHKFSTKSYSDEPPVETGRLCEKLLCEKCQVDKRNGKCGLEGCEFRIIRSGFKQVDHLKHIKFKCPMGNCEAKLSFEGFCIHASEGCHAKPLRKKEIPLEETGYLRKDKNNNNFQLQSYEEDEQTNMVHAMPKRPPVTRIEDENLGRSMESLKLRDEGPEKERSRQKKNSKENNKKEAIPSNFCGTPLSSVKAPEGYYDDNPAFDALRQQGIALKNGMLGNHENFDFPMGMRPVPEVSGHPKDRQFKVVPERHDLNMQQQNIMYPTHTPDGFLIPPDIDVPPDGAPIPKKPSGRAPPTHEEMIINLTAEKDALEEKLLQERKDWRAEQKRLKNKISVLEKLSTDFKGSDEGLGKVVRELQAHAVQVEKERDAAQRKVRHLEKVMEKIVNDSSRQSAAALKLADSQEKMRGKILSSLDFYQQIPDK